MDSNMANTVKRFLDVGTAVIADVFDNMGKTPKVLDNRLYHLLEPARPFAGPAYTIEGESYRWSDGSGDRGKLQAIDDMTPGIVPVWAGGDIRGVCCFGDLLSEAMKARGVAGLVVDGGVRDRAFLKSIGLPMMVRYHTPAQAIGRWRVMAVQKPVKVRGALEDWLTINPGDMIVADEDGVAAIPFDLVEEFLDRAERWAAKDSQARAEIRQGAKLIDTLNKYGSL